MTCINEATVWLIGATSGIGEAILDALVKRCNYVIVSGRNEKALGALASKYGHRVKPLVIDVASQASCEQALTELNNATDFLDCVICSAGVCEYEDSLTFDPGMYERTFNTNFLGVVRALHMAKPLLEKSEKGGRFVAVGSLSSVVPFPRAEAYGASKAALEYFIKACHIDLAKSSVSVSLVRPGFVKTPLTANNDFPMPFLQTSEQAAQRVVEGIDRGQLIIDFPKRLSFMLRFAHWCERLWLSKVAPSLARQ